MGIRVMGGLPTASPVAVGSAAGRPGGTLTRSDQSIGSGSKHGRPRLPMAGLGLGLRAPAG